MAMVMADPAPSCVSAKELYGYCMPEGPWIAVMKHGRSEAICSFGGDVRYWPRVQAVHGVSDVALVRTASVSEGMYGSPHGTNGSDVESSNFPVSR